MPIDLHLAFASATHLPECRAARAAWVKRTSEAWRIAQEQMDERCMAAVEKLNEAEFDRLFAEEEAKVERFRGPLRQARKHDGWPRELYRGGI